MDDYQEPSNDSRDGAAVGSDNWGQIMEDFGVKAENADTNPQPAEGEENSNSQPEEVVDGENANPQPEDSSSQPAEIKDEATVDSQLAEIEVKDSSLINERPAKLMEIAIVCAANYLPQDRRDEISNSIHEIEQKEQYGTILALSKSGKLTEEQKQIALQLKEDGIAGEMMTPDEAEAVYNYINNANEEIVKQKVDDITDMVSKIRCGIEHERSLTPRQERFLDYMTSKRTAYDRGQVRTDLPFDIKQMYLDENEAEDIEFYRKRSYSEMERFSYGEIPFTEEELGDEYEIPILDIDEEEYLTYFAQNDNYVFACGPYTNKDIKEIEYLCSPYELGNGDVWGEGQTYRTTVWAQPISSRLLDVFVPVYMHGEKVGKKHREGATNEFREETPKGYSAVERGSLSEALTVDFIAKDVLKNRRPNARDILALATSIGESVEDIDKNTLNDSQKKSLRHLNAARSYMSKYILEAAQISKDEAKALYGKARPTNKQFYEDSRTRTEAWTDDMCNYYDEERYDTMIKLYDWMLRCIAIMPDVVVDRSADAGNMPGLSADTEQHVPEVSEDRPGLSEKADRRIAEVMEALRSGRHAKRNQGN